MTTVYLYKVTSMALYFYCLSTSFSSQLLDLNSQIKLIQVNKSFNLIVVSFPQNAWSSLSLDSKKYPMEMTV